MHGNIGRSIIDMRDQYTDERLMDNSYVLVHAAGSTQEEMMAVAEIGKSDVERRNEILSLRIQQATVAISILASGVFVLIAALGVISFGTAAILATAVGLLAGLAVWLSGWIFSSPLENSIKNLYPRGV